MTEHDQANIHKKAEQYTNQAELGRNPQGLHESLLHDMKSLTAAQYQKMLSGITELNEKDRQVNNRLPKLELFSSGGSPIPDSIRAKYDSPSVDGDAQLQGAAPEDAAALYRAPERRATPAEHGSLPSTTGFSEALLQKIGAPKTPANMAVLDAWTKAEGGGDANNPLAVLQRGSGSVEGAIQNFPSIEAGADATAKILQSNHYRDIMQALKNGNDARATAVAVERSNWGTSKRIVDQINR